MLENCMLRAVETGLITNRARPMGSASRSPRFRKASSSTPAARISCKAAFIIRISLREKNSSRGLRKSR